MTNSEKLPNSARAQRVRLLAALEDARGKGVTSYTATKVLGIYHPPSRIKELRNAGHRIVTLWQTVETDISAPRRVARYVLLTQGEELKSQQSAIEMPRGCS